MKMEAIVCNCQTPDHEEEKETISNKVANECGDERGDDGNPKSPRQEECEECGDAEKESGLKKPNGQTKTDINEIAR